jgi:hypothetical protein
MTDLTYSVRIFRDEWPSDPREWDNFGIMFCSHKRYNIGDEQFDGRDFSGWDEVEEWLYKERKAIVVLPLYLYDHSIQSISTTSFVGRAHHGGWDSGQVGFIYATRESVSKMTGWKRFTQERIQKIKDYLRSEVSEYDDWMTGNVWAYEVLDGEGDSVESCYGFIGDDGKKYALTEASRVLEAVMEKEL